MSSDYLFLLIDMKHILAQRDEAQADLKAEGLTEKTDHISTVWGVRRKVLFRLYPCMAVKLTPNYTSPIGHTDFV